MLEMETTAIKPWLLRPTHLTKGHCSVAVPAKKKTTNHRDEGAGQEQNRLSLQKLHDKATKAGPTKSSSH